MTSTLPAALAFTVVLWALWHFNQHRIVCLQCGGWNKHKPGCPFERDK